MNRVSSNNVSHPSSHGASLDIGNVPYSHLIGSTPHLLFFYTNEICRCIYTLTKHLLNVRNLSGGKCSFMCVWSWFRVTMWSRRLMWLEGTQVLSYLWVRDEIFGLWTLQWLLQYNTYRFHAPRTLRRLAKFCCCKTQVRRKEILKYMVV